MQLPMGRTAFRPCFHPHLSSTVSCIQSKPHTQTGRMTQTLHTCHNPRPASLSALSAEVPLPQPRRCLQLPCMNPPLPLSTRIAPSIPAMCHSQGASIGLACPLLKPSSTGCLARTPPACSSGPGLGPAPQQNPSRLQQSPWKRMTRGLLMMTQRWMTQRWTTRTTWMMLAPTAGEHQLLETCSHPLIHTPSSPSIHP